MLQSQFTANAQHPDKYDGQEYTPKRAQMIEPDVSSMTPEDLRRVLRSPFAMPEYAAKFELLVAQAMGAKGQTDDLPLFQKRAFSPKVGAWTKPKKSTKMIERTKMMLKRRDAIQKFLCTSGWVSSFDLQEKFGVDKSTVNTDVRNLLNEGRIESTAVNARRGGGRMLLYRGIPDCDTSPH